ncbi:hypothetical protein MATR_11390 [Marivirga tractuosa]|uniref:Periplasmic heavy metal sensor n=1 Tax=Marivirga tractuosa (strain ATCC 23168 / DSM 4126 / NBRC 15989 / NCIMB 1408 / VKM B-1430 / H-43) TaxID=643867 RepID=E4TKR6_MARTH|nr:hypothetical protein [Marivirga tractuosa]ADR21232.1 hypothetical protein Ftrac_1241 [Marivirga tractuosa DSM 4126]BDD14314.1 hypothetical protein MATR_11390 [Marivirga tractuosa]
MNTKFYKFGFFALLVINLTVVILFIIKPDRSRSENGFKEKIAEQLDLTEDQLAAFEDMVGKHRTAIRALNDQERKLTESYFSQLKSSSEGTEDADKQDMIFQEIREVKSKKLQITYLHLKGMKSLCDEGQMEKFDQVLDKIIPRLTGTHDRTGRMGKRKMDGIK